MWLRHVNTHGSPQDGTEGKTGYRLIWDRWMDPLPKGLNLLPACGNRLCVNPFHMRLVTRSQLIRHYGPKRTVEYLEKLRARCAKLKPEDVRYVRNSKESDEELSAKFGVMPKTIRAVRTHKTWKEVA